MFYAWKYHKKYFYVLVVIGTSLIFSTVYLRYHYVSDVIGGLLLAAFVVLTAKPVYRFFSVSSEKKS
jgi:membrane-associated phospholipid phosphatase